MKRLLGLAVALALATSALAQTSVVNSVNNVFNKVATYHASSVITLATTPTDFVEIKGSATKTVYIRDVRVNCIKTTAGYGVLTLAKRTAVNAGGTSSSITPASSDSTNSTATATFGVYTANPTTVGAGVSMINQYIPFVSTSTLSESRPSEHQFGRYMDQHIVLRGTSQTMTIGFAAQTLTGGICAVAVTWMEM